MFVLTLLLLLGTPLPTVLLPLLLLLFLQDYIGQTGELAITAVFSVADAAVSGEDLLGTREKAEQVGNALLSFKRCSIIYIRSNMMSVHWVFNY